MAGIDERHKPMTDESFGRMLGKMEQRLDTMEQRLDTIDERLERQNTLILRMSERLDILGIVDYRLKQLERWREGFWKMILFTTITTASLASIIASTMVWIAKHY